MHPITTPIFAQTYLIANKVWLPASLGEPALSDINDSSSCKENGSAAVYTSQERGSVLNGTSTWQMAALSINAQASLGTRSSRADVAQCCLPWMLFPLPSVYSLITLLLLQLSRHMKQELLSASAAVSSFRTTWVNCKLKCSHPSTNHCISIFNNGGTLLNIFTNNNMGAMHSLQKKKKKRKIEQPLKWGVLA